MIYKRKGDDSGLARRFKVDVDMDVWLPRATQLIIAIAILVVSHIVGVFVAKVIKERGIEKSANPDTWAGRENVNMAYVVMGQIVYWSIMVVAFITVITRFGVQTASVIAVLGTLGIGIGLALQGVLSDLAAGVLITLFQAYHIGEFIEVNGTVARVKSFNLLHTVVEEYPTGVVVLIPNGMMQTGVLINHTRAPKRVFLIDILVSNDIKDLKPIIKIIEDTVKEYPGVLSDPRPTAGVTNMNSYGTTITMHVPVDGKSYPEIALGLQTKVRDVLAENAIPLYKGGIHPPIVKK